MNSETTGEIAKALAAAQATMQNATLNKVNPHYRSKYADLAAIRDAAIPALAKQEIAVTQMVDTDDGGAVLHTMLTHSSGEWFSSTYPLPPMIDNPQKMGSALTYARRYSLAAMVGISAEEDDDANAASEPPAKSSAQAKRDKDFETIKKKLDAASSLDDLASAWKGVQPMLRRLNDNWKDAATDYKDACKAALEQAESAATDPEQWLADFEQQLADCKTPEAINKITREASAIAAVYPEDIQNRATAMSLDAIEALTTEAA